MHIQSMLQLMSLYITDVLFSEIFPPPICIQKLKFNNVYFIQPWSFKLCNEEDTSEIKMTPTLKRGREGNVKKNWQNDNNFRPTAKKCICIKGKWNQ